MLITICHYCLKIWKDRPFLCECNSNVFMKDYDADIGEILKLIEDNRFTFKFDIGHELEIKI